MARLKVTVFNSATPGSKRIQEYESGTLVCAFNSPDFIVLVAHAEAGKVGVILHGPSVRSADWFKDDYVPVKGVKLEAA